MKTEKPVILCVDDEPLNLEFLDDVLVVNDYSVVTARNGKAAMEKLSDQKIDLVLLDIMMPGINGFDICRQIRQDDRLMRLPVVMITGLESKEDRIRGIEAGADDFLSKPFNQKELLARIKMLLKMKEKHDHINAAYQHITSLNSFGADNLESFNPVNFDFISQINNIIHEAIRKDNTQIEKPEIILVRINDEGIYNWYQYKYENKSPSKLSLWLELSDELLIPPQGKSRIDFYNEIELQGQKMSAVTKKLHSIKLAITNMVSYISRDLCVLALNYGRSVTKYDASVLQSLVMQGLFLKTLSFQVEETEQAFVYMINSLARSAEANDEPTGRHILRVGEYCAIIAQALGMPEKFVRTIRIQARLHDVGKVSIPSQILTKSGKLYAEEWKIMEQHTVYGAKIIGQHLRLKMGSNIALAHHEKWDGSGYPSGLQGEQIPMEGRILNIADQYDALRNPRAYKPAYDHETTCRIIVEGDGRTEPYHFDPKVLKIFKENASRFENIYGDLINQEEASLEEPAGIFLFNSPLLAEKKCAKKTQSFALPAVM